MRKLMVGLMVVASVAGCVSDEIKERDKNRQDAKHVTSFHHNYDYCVLEITVDGCSYLVIPDSDGPTMVHKANCKNPEHGMTKETK